MKALIVSAGLFEDCELLGPYSRLQEEGCQMDVAAPERSRIYGKHGYAVEAGKALREVNPEDYAILVLSGGKAPEQIRREPAALAIAQDFFRSGKPLVIGGRGDPKKRGVVSTASYEARKFGIHFAMPLRLAYRLCPQAVFLPVDYDAYARVSAQIKAILRTFSPVMEDVGIDEAYLDLTASGRLADEVAREIKQRVRGATGLSCSVGIAPNKLLAKIAPTCTNRTASPSSPKGTSKPTLPVRKIPGVGPVTEQHLHRLGIENIGQLAARPPEELVMEFGPAHGAFLHQAAGGVDQRPLVTHWGPKSHSREVTFQRDTGDWQKLARTLAELAREVADELREVRVKGRRVGIKLRFADFETHTREKTLGAATDSAEAIRKTAFACLQCIALNKPVRLLGVRVGELEKGHWP